MEQWSDRDFTQIKPRRPEGTGSGDWEEEEEEEPFSFLWPGAGGDGVEEGGGGEVERSGRNGEDGNEKEDGEEELQQQQQEFEFSNAMSTAASSAVVERLSPSGISPADELFFKGQLLPLHLPPRIQMVKKLVLERQHQREHREQEQEQREGAAPAATTTSADVRNVHRKVDNLGHVNAAMNALSQARFARLFQPKYSKFCNLGAAEVVAPAPARLGASWWDPRDAHVHEYSSAGSFTSTDRDSSGDSSSSRDSNGSSQDCFDSSSAASKDQFLSATDSKGFFHNREVFSTHSAHPERSGGISTWLRPPFKWKVLFGAKKPSTTPSSPSLSTLKPPSPYDIDVQPRAHSMEAAGPSETTFSPSPVSTDRYYSDCSGELTHSGDLLLSSRAFIHGGDMEKYPRGMERARGYLQRYMKALNPTRSSSKDHHHSTTNEGATSTTTTTTRASPAITTSKMFPPFSQSFRFSPKDIPLRMKRPPPPSPSPPPLPGPRRVSTSSMSSELHCDIKGAIAHCKESQKREPSQRKQDDELLDAPQS
jgi:hypothetical protein